MSSFANTTSASAEDAAAAETGVSMAPSSSLTDTEKIWLLLQSCQRFLSHSEVGKVSALCLTSVPTAAAEVGHPLALTFIYQRAARANDPVCLAFLARACKCGGLGVLSEEDSSSSSSSSSSSVGSSVCEEKTLSWKQFASQAFEAGLLSQCFRTRTTHFDGGYVCRGEACRQLAAMLQHQAVPPLDELDIKGLEDPDFKANPFYRRHVYSFLRSSQKGDQESSKSKNKKKTKQKQMKHTVGSRKKFLSMAAAHWYAKAVAYGDQTVSIAQLGFMVGFGAPGIARDGAAARDRFYVRGAIAGDARALSYLGDIYCKQYLFNNKPIPAYELNKNSTRYDIPMFNAAVTCYSEAIACGYLGCFIQLADLLSGYSAAQDCEGIGKTNSQKAFRIMCRTAMGTIPPFGFVMHKKYNLTNLLGPQETGSVVFELCQHAANISQEKVSALNPQWMVSAAQREGASRLASLYAAAGEEYATLASFWESKAEAIPGKRTKRGHNLDCSSSNNNGIADNATAKHVKLRSVDELRAQHERAGGSKFADVAKHGGYLNLLKSGIVADEIPVVVDLMLENNAVARVGLSHNPAIGARGAKFLAFALGEHRFSFFREIYMRECAIGDEGLEAIATALPDLPNLTKLGLDRNDIGDLGCSSLCDVVCISNLATVGLTLNRIGDGGAVQVAEALMVERCPLERVYLNENRICDEGAVALAASLLANRKLVRLGISGNLIGNRGGEAFLASLARPSGSSFDKLCCADNVWGKDMQERLVKLPNVHATSKTRSSTSTVNAKKCHVVVAFKPPLDFGNTSEK